jgi:lysophospholipase L1-like esterase
MVMPLYFGNLASDLEELLPLFDSEIWLDPNDLSTLFQDAAGTTPVTAAGQPVGLIRDKSGNGKHASQATDTKRPILQLDEYGCYYLQFDGINDLLATGNIDFSTIDSLYIFNWIAKETLAQSTKVILESDIGIEATHKFYISERVNGELRIYSAGSVGTIQALISNPTAPFNRLLSYNLSISPPHVIGYENGNIILSDTTTQGTGNYSNKAIYIGSRDDGTLPADVKFYQLIIRKKEATLNQINAIDNYFKARKQEIIYQTLAPNSVNLLVSDYTTISEQSSTKLSFLRSITEGNNYKYCSPGSRVGISTNAKAVKFTVFFNGFVTRLDAKNSVGLLYVDDVLVQTFTNPNLASLTTSTVEVEKIYSTTATRKFELIWPYGDGVDLLSVDVSVDATVIQAPSARPTTKLQFLGDSITHGFTVTNISTAWTFLTANAKNYQLINSGYGSLWAVGSYGSTVVACDAIVVVLGVNNYLSQQALATFKAEYKLMIENIRTTLPAAKIYAVTPFYISAAPLTIPLSDYRAQETDALAEIADANTVVINGLTLMTNSSSRLQDGIHPNDTGAAEIATNLAALIT